MIIILTCHTYSHSQRLRCWRARCQCVRLFFHLLPELNELRAAKKLKIVPLTQVPIIWFRFLHCVLNSLRCRVSESPALLGKDNDGNVRTMRVLFPLGMPFFFGGRMKPVGLVFENSRSAIILLWSVFCETKSSGKGISMMTVSPALVSLRTKSSGCTPF